MTESNSIKSSSGNGFSSCTSIDKFVQLFSHVKILYPKDSLHSISPRVTLTDKAFDFLLCRFIPLHAKYDMCIAKYNEKSKYFFMYELLSTIALYGKRSVVIDCEGLFSVSGNIYHEFYLKGASKGNVEFVTKYHDNEPKTKITSVTEVKNVTSSDLVEVIEGGQPKTKITSVTEVKNAISPNLVEVIEGGKPKTKITSVTEVKNVISSNLVEVIGGGKIYQFFAQLSVAVEYNRLISCNDDVWGSYTDGNIWIFACAKPDKNEADLQVV
jgi:hypothetical protein